jgi:hypothetical protein
MISTKRCANGFNAEVAGPKGCGFVTGLGLVGFAGNGVPMPTISASLPIFLGRAIIAPQLFYGALHRAICLLFNLSVSKTGLLIFVFTGGGFLFFFSFQVNV